MSAQELAAELLRLHAAPVDVEDPDAATIAFERLALALAEAVEREAAANVRHGARGGRKAARAMTPTARRKRAQGAAKARWGGK